MTTPTPTQRKDDSEELLSPDDAAALMADLFFAGDPVLSIALNDAFTRAAGRPTVEDIISALGGELDEEELLSMQADLERFVNDDYTAVAGSSFTRARAALERRIGSAVDEEALRARRVSWLATRAGELIPSFNAAMRASLRRALARYAEDDELSNAEIARSVRGIIPLDERSAAAVLRHRKRLEAPGELTPRQIERAVRIKARALRNLRARRIVDTELARAANEAGLEIVKLAIADGLIQDARKVWYTREDERVCKVCGPLHEVSRRVSSSFPGGHVAPPAHPSCRCLLRYTYTPAPEEA